MIGTIKLYILILDLDSSSQECKKAKPSVPVISQSFRSILLEFGIMSRRVGVMNLILSLSRPFNIQRKEPY